MKKLLFALMLTGIMLTGCGSDNTEAINTIAENMANENVESVYSNISALSPETLVVIDDNLIENYYGILPSDFSEYVFAQAESPMSAETIIIAKANEGIDISDYETNINNIIEQKTGEMTNYGLPDQVKLLKDAKVKFSENGFYVVISDKADIMAETIEKGLGL